MIKRREGFTLIELIIVLAILGILAAMAVPAFRIFQRNSNANYSVEELAGVLRSAQTKTVSSDGDSQYGVYFDTSTSPNQYVLFKGSSYALREASSDEVYSLGSIKISNVDLWGGKEVVFERVTGEASSTSSFGDITLESQDGSTSTVYVANSGLIGLSPPPSVSDTGRLTDSRHIHFLYGRVVSTSTESIILDFGTTTSEIPIAGNFVGGQIYWKGQITVDGQPQDLEIQTIFLNSPETEFCIHRDARYNNMPLAVSLSGDNSGTLISYTASGQESRGSSVYLVLGQAGDPQRQ